MLKKLVLFVMVIFLVTVGSAQAANILLNGSFESGLTDWVVGGTNTGYQPAVILTDGSTGSAFGEAIPIDTIVGGSPDAAGTHGVYFVDDFAHQTLTQSVSLTAGSSYEIGFDAYLPFNGVNNAGNATFEGTIATIKLADFVVKGGGYTAGNWIHFSGLANVGTSGTYDAAFMFDTFGGASADVVIDRAYIVTSDSGGGIPINPVPEPGTMMLLGSGLVGLVGYGRKRLKK